MDSQVVRAVCLCSHDLSAVLPWHAMPPPWMTMEAASLTVSATFAPRFTAAKKRTERAREGLRRSARRPADLVFLGVCAGDSMFPEEL